MREDNKLLSITGSGAGQSGFEAELGLTSKSLFVIDRYLPNGRVAIDTIGTKFLRDYKIYVKAIGLDRFIEDCLTEEASIYGFDEEKKETQPIHQRKLVIGKPYRREVSKID